MRLTQPQREVFKELAQRYFGAACSIGLFGSRTDDSRRGGDIDLFVTGLTLPTSEMLQAKINFLVEAKQRLGDQRIDVVFIPQPGQPRLPIHRVAEETGTPL